MSASVIRFVGTGTAFHHDGRGSQSLLVEPVEAAPFQVDVGPTALCMLQRFEWDYAPLQRLFITHLHGDHIAGWPFLLLNLRFLHARTQPLSVYGPPGVRDCLEDLARLCYGDLLDPEHLGFEVLYHELQRTEARGLSASGQCFDVVPMEHHESSIGYRFQLRDASVAVSGDTAWCGDLELLAEGSDHLVVECTSLERTKLSHVSLEEVRDGIGRLGGCRVVMIHLPDEVAAALAADPIPRVVAGYDGMVLSLD